MPSFKSCRTIVNNMYTVINKATCTATVVSLLIFMLNLVKKFNELGQPSTVVCKSKFLQFNEKCKN